MVYILSPVILRERSKIYVTLAPFTHKLENSKSEGWLPYCLEGLSLTQENVVYANSGSFHFPY